MPRRESKNTELDSKLASGEIILDSPEYWDLLEKIGNSTVNRLPVVDPNKTINYR